MVMNSTQRIDADIKAKLRMLKEQAEESLRQTRSEARAAATTLIPDVLSQLSGTNPQILDHLTAVDYIRLIVDNIKSTRTLLDLGATTGIDIQAMIIDKDQQLKSALSLLAARDAELSTAKAEAVRLSGQLQAALSLAAAREAELKEAKAHAARLSTKPGPIVPPRIVTVDPLPPAPDAQGLNPVLAHAIRMGEARPPVLLKLVNGTDFKALAARGLLRTYEFTDPTPGRLISLPEGGLLVDRLVEALGGNAAAANALLWLAPALDRAELLPPGGDLLVFGPARSVVEVASVTRIPTEESLLASIQRNRGSLYLITTDANITRQVGGNTKEAATRYGAPVQVNMTTLEAVQKVSPGANTFWVWQKTIGEAP